MTASPAQLQQWKLLREEYLKSNDYVAHNKTRDKDRFETKTHMLSLLNDFLSGKIDNEELRNTYDLKTRTEWNQFGFKGLSGGMLLNMLIKHIADQNELASQLKKTLPLPVDEAAAKTCMSSFVEYLERQFDSPSSNGQQRSLAKRCPFFISGWWHLQDLQKWPVFYTSARNSLRQLGLYVPSKNPCENYFHFRSSFISLAQSLQIDLWELEHVCVWYENVKSIKPTPNIATDATPAERATHQEPQPTFQADDIAPKAEVTPAEESAHTQVQFLLAQIGLKIGCKIWIASNDRGKSWQGKTLASFSLPELPNLGMGNDSQKTISLIDVLWLSGNNQVRAAFEVEHSTSIYSGILRMADLAAVVPNLLFPLYLVAPANRIPQVKKQLARPTFQALKLHKRCAFFSTEKLIENSTGILKWANDLSAIEQLAEKVDDFELD